MNFSTTHITERSQYLRRVRLSLGIVAASLYLPFSWLLVTETDWHAYQRSWIKLWPILPGLMPGALLFQLRQDVRRCILRFRPEGEAISQPRATPWVIGSLTMFEALKGRHDQTENCVAPSGLGGFVVKANPGRRSRWSLALGWLMAAPLGRKRNAFRLRVIRVPTRLCR